MVSKLQAIAVCLAAASSLVSGQTFRRLGTCPTLGCILPPDQQDFLPGQLFDIRFEVHAPKNGSEAFNNGVPDEKFTATIVKEEKGHGKGPRAKSLTEFFGLKQEPKLEKWTFSWFEDLFAKDAKTPSVVNVASKVYRSVALYEPGTYTVVLDYYGGKTTVATWVVRPLAEKKKAKNVIFFIGDGMTTNMITAARLLAHKTINGKYQSLLQLDKFPVLGHQMSHSIDTFITDSANSASALYSGHKSTVNAMGVYADSSPDAFDDPKVETIVELLSRIWGSAWGAVSTAFLADATPIALTAHTRSRGHYGPLIDQVLNGVTANYSSWTGHDGPDVFFGGGAENFLPGSGSYLGKDYYTEFAKKGYSVSLNKTALLAAPKTEKALGVFCKSNLPVWLERNIFPENLDKLSNDPAGGKGAAKDLPGLKEMTLKAIDILHTRSKKGAGFFLMSEAASIDKMMHVLDYDRALGDLLELDDTIRATVEKLTELGILDDTLIIVSADHGHGFDVFGSADTKYLASQDDDRSKRDAIGVYENSGLSQYTIANPAISYNTGPNFPLNWDPRYVLAAGLGANPDRREAYGVDKSGPRTPAAPLANGSSSDYYANAKDKPNGFLVNGTLPTDQAQGVHSLTDVPVYAMGPCQETFGGTYNNIDVFYKIATCLGLGHGKHVTQGKKGGK
ncbi:alkaline phosphatase [Cercophora newfieldiana]|uniref:alkaline phosphatase n=1 Tax=Cercophora newfieldiana TaxID=92897 RepID=A0AA39YPI2_9PEZI|nr:alkaline phosphatase [Cercophora newfieldiana]